MAIGKCRECGKEASSEAKSCPHCGATKPVVRTSTSTKIIGGFFALVIAVSIFNANKSSPPPPPAPPETPAQKEAKAKAQAAAAAAKAKEELTFQKTVIAAKALKGSLRDPESLAWESIRANEEATVICMEYRARNGFGGMNKEFVVLVKGKASQKPEVWNKHCTQPLWDMKHVKYAL